MFWAAGSKLAWEFAAAAKLVARSSERSRLAQSQPASQPAVVVVAAADEPI